MLGKFIVIEGSDWTGKSTIVAKLSEWLSSKSVDNVITRHPGATPIGAALRKVLNESKDGDLKVPPRTEGLIMAADNAAFIELVLKPNLNQGTWVIGDRNNFISGLVYQIKSGASLSDLDKIQDATSSGQPKIDLLFILKADENTRDQRRAARSDGKVDRFESRGKTYMDEVVRAYERLAEEQSERLLKFVKSNDSMPDVPLVFYIDAAKPVDAVLNAIIEVIESMLLCQQG